MRRCMSPEESWTGVTYFLSVAAMIATWPVTLAKAAKVAVGFFAIGTGALLRARNRNMKAC